MKRALRTTLLAGLVFGVACHPEPGRSPRGGPLVVFMSDFGTVDDSVAICKGVMLEIEPRLRIIDLTHDVTPYSIRDGARYLAGAAPYFPQQTVFVAVVDPGVGGTRRALVARSRRGQLFVLPDNGLLTLVAQTEGLTEVRAITNPRLLRAAGISSTFHGRDVFSPVGAHLARGAAFEEVGPTISEWVRLEMSTPQREPDGLRGEVVGLDGPYGNLITNIDADTFHGLGYGIGEQVPVELGTERLQVRFARTFSDVPKGEPLLYVDSRGRIALAINQGDFARQHRVSPPVPLRLRRKP